MIGPAEEKTTSRLASTLVATGVTLCLAALSIALQGFLVGRGNNAFQIPIALSLFDLPQFANDPFIQSLRGYTSLVWEGVRRLAPSVDLAALLPALHFTSRWLLYASFYAFLRIGAKVDRPATVALLFVLAISSIFSGSSPVGRTGLQIEYFSHSELATPFMLLAFLAQLRGRFRIAFAVAGLTFNINAFMGAWTIAILSFVQLAALIQRPHAAILARWSAGLMGAGLIALPTALWIASTPPGPAFDYSAFLWSYYPDHFFISAAQPANLAAFSCAVVAALVGLAEVTGEARRGLGMLMIGVLLLFGIGAVLPEFTSQRMLLNLHLLRADVLVLALALITVTAAAAKYWNVPTEIGRPASVAVVAAALVGSWWLVAVAVASAALWRRGWLTRGGWAGALALAALIDALCFANGRFGLAALAAAAVAVSATSVLQLRPAVVIAMALLPASVVVARQLDMRLAWGWFADKRPYWNDWVDVQRWAARNTPVEALFMVPLDMRLIGFQIESQRRIWVDFRQGAAAMWHPGFYPVWAGRLAEQRALSTLAERLRYACSHGISHLVERESGAAQWPAVYENGSFSVIEVTGCPGIG